MANSTNISKSDKEILFSQTKVLLGVLSRDLELEDEALDVLLTISIEEYSSYINDWLIQQTFGNLQGLSADKNNILEALVSKTLDFEKSFSYAFSKQTGIGTNSRWPLLKSYIILENQKQTYEIPAGREINEVLWLTPPQIGSTGTDLLSPVNWTSTQFGWNLLGNSAISILPAFNMYLYTQDIKMKKNILQSESTYRITAGPNGTKILYLYPVPGSRDEQSGARSPIHKAGDYVWYFYYDTSGGNRDECLEENDDIIKTANDVPINNIPWSKLNSSSKTKVRRLLIAEAKNYIATIRGKFSGKIEGRNGKEITMDYGFLLEQSKEEKAKIYDELKDYLTKMTYRTMMEDKAAIAESLNTVLKFVPPADGGMQMH